ncbi:MAG TPA: FeoC-like transcriptional regulator [Thiolinea sp.]|nr:FeoC-like transcriptional regulator [Thiolinea sp.]
MMLGDIRNYLQQQGQASLNQVAVHFDIAPDTARFALGYWQKKGKVLEQNTAAACGGGCGSACGKAADPVYVWAQRAVPLQRMTRRN